MGDYANAPPKLLVGSTALRQRGYRVYRLLVLSFAVGHVTNSVTFPPASVK